MKTYTGGCHCKKVHYEAEVNLDKIISCNCSHCSAKGMLLIFIPASQFKLLAGEDILTEYRFNKKVIQHLFCSVCGVQSFARGTDPKGVATVALNVRCLDGLDINTLNLTPFDGKNW